MRKRCFFFIVFILFLVIILNTNTAYPFSVQVNIHGQVLGHLEGGSSRPVGGALVSVDFSGTVIEDITDQDGYYVLQGLVDVSPGQYTVTATDPSCDPEEYILIVTSGWDGEEQINFDLSCSVAGWPGYINGCVYDSLTGSPIAGCEVTYWNDLWEPSSIITLPNGCYSVTVDSGWWNITASMAGYESETYTDVFVGKLATVVLDFNLLPLADDSDEDGIIDNEDNCPNHPNPNQEDADTDGVGDACDQCNGDDASGDTDGDGDCNDVDTDDDDDGMPDEWEDQYDGLNPLVDDAGGDLDKDGFSNYEEYMLGSDPSNRNDPKPKTMPWIPFLLE